MAGQFAENLNFSAQRIALDEVRGWSRDDGGNIVHESGQFFSIEGTRISSGALKEVKFWDQPIYNQSSGGILAMVTRAPENGTIEFLLQARVDPEILAGCNFAQVFKVPGPI